MTSRINKMMENLKKQNPNVSWENLLTGIAVLVLVAVFSYSYFSRSGKQNMVIDDRKLMEEVGGNTSTEEKDSVDEADGDVETTADNTPIIPAEPGEKGSATQTGTTVVQKGEGLWHVAQRVCGDGEKYNVLAAANGLNVWQELNEGMTIKVVCK